MGTWMAWANKEPSKLLCKHTCNFLNRDGMWLAQEPPCSFSTRITSGFLNLAHERMKVTSHLSSAQLAQSEAAVNLLSITIFCLYCGVLPGFY